jgi:hypothetical protein
MGRNQVRTIRVPKWVTFALLCLVTGAMIVLLYLLSGRAYAGDTRPLSDLFAGVLGIPSRTFSREAFLVILMPLVGNFLLFAPWGFLAFLLLDTPKRPRAVTYAAVVFGALLFAGAMYLWQQSLPTQVTSLPDVLVNGAGAFAGSALGHARKSVHFRFQV